MTEFEKYLKEAREDFVYEVSKYTVENNLALRTASDSLLIAFDQATEKAINYIHCCKSDNELLKDKPKLNFEDWYIIFGYTKRYDDVFIKRGVKYSENVVRNLYKTEYLQKL